MGVGYKSFLYSVYMGINPAHSIYLSCYHFHSYIHQYLLFVVDWVSAILVLSCTESGECYLFTVREMGKYIYKWKQKWRKNWREHIIHVWSNTARNIIWLAMRLHYTILMFLKKTVQMNTYQTIIFSYNYAHLVHRNNKWWLTKYQ